jgi:hypothetical protein
VLLQQLLLAALQAAAAAAASKTAQPTALTVLCGRMGSVLPGCCWLLTF